MTTYTQIATGYHLDSSAAQSYERMRSLGLPAGGINSALRTRQEQENEFFRNYQHSTTNAYLPLDRRVYKGTAYYRKRGGVAVSVPGSAKSRHEKGLALDIATASSAQAWMLKHGAQHGWHRPLWDAYKQEPWHWEYRASYDKKPKPKPKPKPEPKPSVNKKEVEMFITRKGRSVYVLVTGSKATNISKQAAEVLRDEADVPIVSLPIDDVTNIQRALNVDDIGD